MSNSEVIKKLQSHCDSLAQITPEEGIEFWFARDLQEPLGYAKWENFLTTIMRAVESCKTTGCDSNDHFLGVRKMISLGKGAERAIEGFMASALSFIRCFWVFAGSHVEHSPSCSYRLF